MTDLITAEEAQELLDGATPGPWEACGEVWSRKIYADGENRVCFMAHSNGLDDDRDITTSELVASAPNLAHTVIALHAELAQARADAQAAVALVVERAAGIADDPDIPAKWLKRDAIRALAPMDGLAEVAKLRTELLDMTADRDSWKGEAGHWMDKADEMRADRLAADNAALQEQVKGLKSLVRRHYAAQGQDLSTSQFNWLMKDTEAALAAVQAKEGGE